LVERQPRGPIDGRDQDALDVRTSWSGAGKIAAQDRIACPLPREILLKAMPAIQIGQAGRMRLG